ILIFCLTGPPRRIKGKHSRQSHSAHVSTYREMLMSKFRMLLGVLLVALLVGGLALAQDKKDTKDTPPAKAKGTLPANWKKLGLTDDQVQKVYQIQTDHRGQIGALQQKIKQLQQEERTAMMGVLTDAQKARLKELATADL